MPIEERTRPWDSRKWPSARDLGNAERISVCRRVWRMWSLRVFSLVEIVCGVGLLIVGRVGIFGLVCFRFFRKQQARASAQDSAIGPVFFVEEDLAVARITVIPA